MEKAKLLVSAKINYEATKGQWFQKSEKGKSWELWMIDGNGLLRFLTRIPTKRILWVLPMEEEKYNGQIDSD